jgi:hypothetical protein
VLHLVSYATLKYRHRQIFLSVSAKINGLVDTTTSWTPSKLIATNFNDLNPDISIKERGSGFWSWKPFIIQHALNKVPDGDIVIYCDVGRKYPYITLNTPFDAYIRWMEEHKQDIMPGIMIPWSGSMEVWTKRAAFTAMEMDYTDIHKSAPIQASFSIWQACPKTRSFVSEWLSLCIQRPLISDDSSITSITESSVFRAHRHDQSLLTLCCIKHGIKGIDIGPQRPIFNERDPSQVSLNVFQSNPKYTVMGRLLKYLIYPIEIIEKHIRALFSFGNYYN